MSEETREQEICLHGRNGDNMAVLAKPINKLIIVSEKESRNFVREFNKNKVTDAFLDSCKKAGKLFDRKK
jgi:hypothetical protein